MSGGRIPRKALGITCGSNPISAGSGLRLEVFVDFTCPFSKILWERLVKEVKVHYSHKLELIFQLVPQPWHPSSCMVHESYHAACLASPFKQEELFVVTMENALLHFADTHTLEMSRKKLHEKIALIYEVSSQVDKHVFLKNLELDRSDGQINGGNNATRLVKLCKTTPYAWHTCHSNLSSQWYYLRYIVFVDL